MIKRLLQLHFLVRGVWGTAPTHTITRGQIVATQEDFYIRVMYSVRFQSLRARKIKLF